MGFIERFIKQKAVEWLAKQLGVSPAMLSGILDDIIGFIKEIFDTLSPAEQLVFFRQGQMALASAKPDRVKQILKDIKEAASNK